MEEGNRRRQIGGAAIAILADGGARALTHAAVDRQLGLARGSTSYYARTRQALVDAAAEELVDRSHAHFTRLVEGTAQEPDPAGAAALIARYVRELCTRRRDDVRARLALFPEVDSAGRERLAGALFSADAATALCRALGHAEPEIAASGLLDLLEGAVVRSVLGSVPAALPDLEWHLMRHLGGAR